MPFLGVGSGTVLQQGTASARPTASTALQGIYYFATDTNGGTLYQCTGAAWVQLAPGVNFGAAAQIAQTALSGSAANITLSSIPALYSNLMLTVTGRGDTGTNPLVQMQLNSDTGANYQRQLVQGAGNATIQESESLAATNAFVGYLSGDSDPANEASSFQITLFDYRGTTFQKTWAGNFVLFRNTTTTNMFVGVVGGAWLSTSAVTSIKLFLDAGNFKAGCVATLYGLA